VPALLEHCTACSWAEDVFIAAFGAAALDILDKYDAKATFFIIGAHVDQCDVCGAGDGRFEAGRALLRRMTAEGHELGNHTW